MAKIDPQNKKSLDYGFAKAQQLIQQHLASAMSDLCMSLSVNSARECDWHSNMTGNMITSHVAGFYTRKGGLVKVVRAMDVLGWSKPISRKFSNKGAFPKGKERYDGDVQEYSFRPTIKTDKQYGYETAESFLKSKGLESGADMEVCVTNGIEYSDALADKLGHDILQTAFENTLGTVTQYFAHLPQL